MKNYAEMSDFEINSAVASALGVDFEAHETGVYVSIKRDAGNVVSITGIVDYCNNWADAGPVISSAWNHLNAPVFNSCGEFICTEWQARVMSDENANQLRAAMIVFLMMKDADK